jgi:hypothetical protein
MASHVTIVLYLPPKVSTTRTSEAGSGILPTAIASVRDWRVSVKCMTLDRVLVQH